MKRVLLRVDEELYARVVRSAQVGGMSVNAEMCAALAAWCDDVGEGDITQAVHDIALRGDIAVSSITLEEGDITSTSKPVPTTDLAERNRVAVGIIGEVTRRHQSKLVTALRVSDEEVRPNCPSCATDMVKVWVAGREKVVCPRCTAG